VRKMANRFVKTVRSGNRLYHYLVERVRVNDKTIQRIVRPLTEEQAALLGHRAAGTYDAVSAVFRLPLCGALLTRLHEHNVTMEVWAELDSGKTVLPCQVIFEPAEIPSTRFRFLMPAASKPVAIAIALRSSQTGNELNISPPSLETSTRTVRSDAVPLNLRRNATPNETVLSA
jgi:hypothetical protein